MRLKSGEMFRYGVREKRGREEEIVGVHVRAAFRIFFQGGGGGGGGANIQQGGTNAPPPPNAALHVYT